MHYRAGKQNKWQKAMRRLTVLSKATNLTFNTVVMSRERIEQLVGPKRQFRPDYEPSLPRRVATLSGFPVPVWLTPGDIC